MRKVSVSLSIKASTKILKVLSLESKHPTKLIVLHLYKVVKGQMPYRLEGGLASLELT